VKSVTVFRYFVNIIHQNLNPLTSEFAFSGTQPHYFQIILSSVHEGIKILNTITSKKEAFSGSSNLLKGPSFTVKPLLQKTMLWTTDSGCWLVVDCAVSPESNLPVPVKLVDLGGSWSWSRGLSTAPSCLAWLKIASTSFPFEGSWTSIPLEV